jgi:Ser/Thr protein kinase RdoA (MazF antagonist)
MQRVRLRRTMDRFEQLPESEKVDRYTRLARKALSAYGLNEARLSYLGGPTDATFEVTTGDPSRHYALRICSPDRSPDGLRREILWLTALRRDTDLAVPEPILTMDGELVRKVAIAGVPGFRPCVLLRWVEGESLDRELVPEHLRSVGRTVAKLHSHAETFRWPEEITPPRRNATLMSEVLDEDLLRVHYAEDELDLFREAIELVAVTMTRLRDGPTVAGVIHGDLHRRNVLFHENEARMIGFETCRWGYYAYDLAVAHRWIEGREASDELTAALLDGYRTIRDLPKEVEQYVPVFAALRSIDRAQSILSRLRGEGQSAQDLVKEYGRLRRAVEAA